MTNNNGEDSTNGPSNTSMVPQNGDSPKSGEGITETKLQTSALDQSTTENGEASDALHKDAGNSQMIEEATEVALQATISMKQSDSILLVSDRDSDVSDASEPIHFNSTRENTDRYMEEAPLEAALVNTNQNCLSPSGNVDRSTGEIVHSQSNADPRNSFPDDATDVTRSEKLTTLFSATNLPTLNNGDIATHSTKLNESTGDKDKNDAKDLLTFLKLNGVQIPDVANGNSEDALLIHSIFRGFCSPALGLDCIESVLDMERGESKNPVDLPIDIVIENPSAVLYRLLGLPLFDLPSYFSLSLLRILLRLLTNDTDEEYDYEVLKSCPWLEDLDRSSVLGNERSAFSRDRTLSVNSLKDQPSVLEKSPQRDDEGQIANRLYTIVRFRRNWNAPVSGLLSLIEEIMKSPQHKYLEGPIVRLLGILCTASVKVNELRRILALISADESSPQLQLLLTRALRTAAAGASRSSLLAGKASPRSFFSFVSGPGITRTMNLERSPWPFRNDFSIAVWFRAERFSQSSTLLRICDQSGNGMEVSIIPFEKDVSENPMATILAVSVLQGGKVVNCVKVQKCILHPRVWYHVAIRHRRSGLKGVFSLSSREQLSVILDGKLMLSEPLKFPSIPDPLKSLTVSFGANFDGQTGSLYIFHDNVSEATFRALYETTAGTVHRRQSAPSEWDARRGDIVKKSRALDLNMKLDDIDDIVLSQRNSGRETATNAAVVDLEEDEHTPLSKIAFNSRLFIVWDPNRIENGVALELQSGAHARIDLDNVYHWTVECAQDIVGSIGGVQALLPPCRSLLSGKAENSWESADLDAENPSTAIFRSAVLCSLIPDMILLLSSFVRDHHENAREMLRCGGIDIIEQLLQRNKRNGKSKALLPASSLVASISVFPRLSQRLTKALLELHLSCSHYVGLETKVFSSILFNFTLWFGGNEPGIWLYTALLPVLSSTTVENPKKVRDCVGIKDLIYCIKQTVESRNEPNSRRNHVLFQREFKSLSDIQTAMSKDECRRVIDVYLAMIFAILSSGTDVDGFSQFIHMLSDYLEYEWGKASQEQQMMQDGGKIQRSGVRNERYLFVCKASLVLLLLFQTSPSIPGLYESFAATCGSVQDGAAWILSAVVNSFSDEIRTIGVRLLVAYVERTSKSPDLPLALENPIVLDVDKSPKVIDNRASLQGNTLSIISNVGQGLLNSNVGKGLAASVRSRLLSPTQLTARVIYKLLWHLLKSHRHRMGKSTQAGLTSMVFAREEETKQLSMDSLKENFLASDDLLGGVRIEVEWIRMVLEDNIGLDNASFRNPLGMSTILRLLRFLPGALQDEWLVNLYKVSSQKRAALEALSSSVDWQSCVFQFLSELVERISNIGISLKAQTEVGDTDDHQTQLAVKEMQALERRLDLTLELYASLLGHRLREGGDQASVAVEDAASLQRVCLNGQEVFTLVLSRVCANLSTFGVVSLDRSTNATSHDEGQISMLKRSARLVTDTILSNGSKGIAMPAAVGCWRCLRHITAVTVAVITRLGFGVAEQLDPQNAFISTVDAVSEGLYGIRLHEGDDDFVSSSDLRRFHEKSGLVVSSFNSGANGSNDARDHDLHLRMCLSLSEQLLSLLDVFIFPDSLDASLPASQLHGLALVRSTETRIGSSQGPLLASLIRLSLLLLGQLEPCSVKILQCSSRLRCFLHWIFELIREAESLEGYSAAFNKLTAPFDRMILAVLLQCHRTLGRCSALLREIESVPFDIHFDSKDSQRKSHRRLLRVGLEVRDILVAIMERRSEVLKASLSTEAFEALKKSLEISPSQSNGMAKTGSSQKEMLVRNLLLSDWVGGYQGVHINDSGGIPLPEQLRKPSNVSPESEALSAVRDLLNESEDIMVSFEKSLNICFEKYLETQRKWAETGAVRELECEGDAAMKRLSQRHSSDMGELSKVMLARKIATDGRWKNIDLKTEELWDFYNHWMLAKYTDRLGRRILLVRNRQFDDHAIASYDLQMGKEREKEEREREERLRKKREQVSDLMKRNIDAFKPQNVNEILDDDKFGNDVDADYDLNSDETSRQEISNLQEGNPDGNFEQADTFGGEEAALSGPLQAVDDDTDAWARAFIWSENEILVARFDSVMIVTLQFLVEGKLVLTTHGLYFHQIGDATNVVSKESISSEESTDRRWRLSRLTEVHGRRYMLRSQALELFFSGSHELFLNFLSGTRERDRFYAKLRNSCRVPMLFSPRSLNPRSIFRRSKLTEMWKKRKISNFEYIMALNRMAGRTFNDIAQYPVFPWILADYSSEKIDLTDYRVYRDLSKPVGALNPDRLSQLVERYNQLEQFGFAENEKFLYGSHYSSPGVILHYMIRQEPFTSMAIDLQSGRFDCPDRLFFDLSESWKSCNTSSSDVKELIPEFFTLPEILLNTNNFPLGTTQKGRSIGNVGLPPWAKGSAYEFVKIHRLALESEYVSKNLHHWVDLIFGYKQRGPEAEKAHNIFHHLSYEGSVDLDKITDELDRQAAESHIANFGQTPSQLLVSDPHPARSSPEVCWEPLINNMSTTVRLRCQTPSRQFGGKRGGCGSVAKIHVQGDVITAIYSDLKVGTFKWAPKSSTGRLKCEKLKSLPNRHVSNSRSVIKRGSAAPQTMDRSGSKLAVGNWSFAITVGGYEKEQQRRKAVMPSRLASAKDALYTDAALLIVSCGYWDHSVKVHSTDAWRLERSDTGGHRGAIRCLAMGQDGGFLVTGGEDCTCRIWVVDHPDMAIALSDGYVQTVLGQTTDGDHAISCCHVLWGHQTPITCVDLSSDLDVVVSGSLDGRICVHTLRRGEYVRSMVPLADVAAPIDKVIVDGHGRIVAHTVEKLFVYTVNGVLLCSADTGERIHDMVITGEVLVTGGDRCHVYIRDLTSLRVLSSLDLSRHGPIRSITLTPDELNPLPQILFIGSDDGMISIVDREEDK